MPPKKSAAQKKKALSNARGFATVSIPKKPDPTPVKVTPEPEPAETEKESLVPQSTAPVKNQLRLLAERIKASTDKEVPKLLKLYEREISFSRTFSTYTWPNPGLQLRVLNCATQTLDQSQLEPPSDGTEENVLTKLMVLWGVLEGLGFTNDRIIECLTRSSRFPATLDQLLDWLFLHCETFELVLKSQPQSTVEVEQEPRERVPPINEDKYIPTNEEIRDLERELDAKVLPDESGSDSDNERSFNQKYVQLKLKLSEITRAHSTLIKRKGKALLSSDEKQLFVKQEVLAKKLSDEIAKVKGEYEFRLADAEKLFRIARIKLDSKLLADKLNSIEINDPPYVVEKGKNGKEEASKEDDDIGMFGGLLEEAATETITDQGVVVPIRDMTIPQTFSGKQPQQLLIETVKRLDRDAVCNFRAQQISARVAKAHLTIKWSSRETQTFSMDEFACLDKVQAFNVVAIMGLFTLGPRPANLPESFGEYFEELDTREKEEKIVSFEERLRSLQSFLESRIEIKRIANTPNNTPRPATATPTTPQETLKIKIDQLKVDFLTITQSTSYQEMLAQRAQLPIAAYREDIVNTIAKSQVLILCGETGCGKSTQLPSFIVESQLSQGIPVKVYCTEPRRISAISLARRVSIELGEVPGQCGNKNSLVGYSIRLDSKVSRDTKIIYATTGIVLRMLEDESGMSDCTHLVVDEVHERGIDSDFLLIILRQILSKRPALKVILMSATVDAEKLSVYMGGCPVINVPGRTFPVESYFLEDAVELTDYTLDLSMVDSPYLSKKARGSGKNGGIQDLQLDSEDEDPNTLVVDTTYSKNTRNTISCMAHYTINFELITMLLEQICIHNQLLVPFSQAILVFLPSLDSIKRLCDILESHPVFGSSEFIVLPLHSTLASERQTVVFDVPPSGVRKIVVSTNIAETGVTIPDITAVIDSGLHREMRYDEKKQISRLVQTFVAQANAKQRRGRAGRVQAGICFHLFTKHRFEKMEEHPQPEIMRLSLQDLALRVKLMQIGTSIEQVLLQALDPPQSINIQRAISALIEVKALTTTEEITPLGRHLAKLPMDAHLGKFLIMSCLFGCLDAALTITATLNSKSPWVTPFEREAEAQATRNAFKTGDSDFLTVYNAYRRWRETCERGSDREFIRKNFLSLQTLQAIEDLKQQYLTFLVDIGFVTFPEGTRREAYTVKYGRNRFVRIPESLNTHSLDSKTVTACFAASMYPKLLIVENNELHTLSNNTAAAIHPSSVNFVPGRGKQWNTRFVTFFTAMRTKKLYAWETAYVDELPLYLLCGQTDFNLPARSLKVDRKIRVCFEDPKTAISIRVLRQEFNQLFLARMKAPNSTANQQWLDFIREAIQGDMEEDKKGAFEKEKVVVK